MVVKVSQFYQEKLNEKEMQIELLENKLKEAKPQPTVSQENKNAENVTTVICANVEENLDNPEWMMNLIEANEVVLFKEMSKTVGICNQIFWENLMTEQGMVNHIFLAK